MDFIAVSDIMLIALINISNIFLNNYIIEMLKFILAISKRYLKHFWCCLDPEDPESAVGTEVSGCACRLCGGIPGTREPCCHYLHRPEQSRLSVHGQQVHLGICGKPKG